MKNYTVGIDCAKELDREDKISHIRERFYTDEFIYMDGNSLGLLSKDAEKRTLEVLEIWKKHGIGMWNVQDGKYFLYPQFLGKRMARLIKAKEGEVTITNSTTINIHQMLSTFYMPDDKKNKIIVDELNFPTDKYAVDSHVRLRGYNPEEYVKVIKSRDGRTISEEDVIEAMTEDVALILLPSVFYRSAQLMDMKKLTEVAHERDIIIGWDLCHSIGVVEHDFEDIQPDFAIWCNYKYLSGGPGTVAGIYINQKHFNLPPGMAGWHGNKKSTQFQLNTEYEPAPDADRWLTGTAPIVSMAGIEGMLDIYESVSMSNIREKSLSLTKYMMYLIEEKLSEFGFVIGNPKNDKIRGGHVALEHEEAYKICQALKAHNVIPDFREPNVIRLAPIALYTTFEEVYNVIDIIKNIYETEEYKNYSEERTLVV